ncbi:MAG: PspC domain-containing protein [Candidatus Methanoperedens sp.]|nr:PspC domain-containing protein [Candidatus Methanoperedens sp.]
MHGERITKSKTDKVIDGVCGGIAEYFGIDSVIVRLIFVVLVFLNGIGLLLYIILVIIMPNAEQAGQPPKETIQENVQEIGERVKETGEGLGQAFSRKTEEKHSKRAVWFGIILILLGIYFLLENLHLIPWIDRDILWPIIIILVGVWLLIKRWS